ncbi:MAG: DUF4339 domain-containing protein [Bacteriovoracaceae bacterium]
MKQKIWFLFKENHHTGPFSSDQIKEKFDRGEISTGTPVCREGDDSWQPLIAHPELSVSVLPDDVATPTDLPPLPENTDKDVSDFPRLPEQESSSSEDQYHDIEEKFRSVESKLNEVQTSSSPSMDLVQQTQVLNQNRENDEDDLWIVDDQNLESSEVIDNNTEAELAQSELSEESQEIEDQAQDELDEFIERPKSLSYTIRKFAVIFFFIALAAFGVTQFAFKQKKIPPLTHLKQSDARTLKVALLGNKKSFRFAIAPDKGLRSLWFSTNVDEPGSLEITLKSITGRVLSKQEIAAKGRGRLKNNVGKISNLELTRGDLLVDGEYEVEGRLVLEGPRVGFYRWINENTPLKESPPFNKFKFEHKIKTTLRYMKKSGDEFNTKLHEFKESLRLEASRPLIIEMQKWRTFQTLTTEVYNLFSKSLDAKSLTSASKQFNRDYARSIAPVFQTLSIDTQTFLLDDSFLKTKDQKRRLSELTSMQKSFGNNVVALNSLFKRYKRVNRKLKNQLRESAVDRLKPLQEKIKNRISELQKEISKI